MSDLLKRTLQSNANKQAPLNRVVLKKGNGALSKAGSPSSAKPSPPPKFSPTPPPAAKPATASVPWPPSLPMPSASAYSSAASTPAADIEIIEVSGYKKKKQRVKHTEVYSQPVDTGSGTQINTQLVYAVKKLKDHQNPIRLEDLAIQANVPITTNAELREKFLAHDRVLYDSRTDTYSYKPDYNIRNKEQLLTEITRHYKLTGGMPVKTIKESWPNAATAIEELIQRGDVIGIRTKDQQLKTVFLNEVAPSRGGQMLDKEFRDIWEAQRVPEEDILLNDLQKAGQQAAASEAGPKPGGIVKRRGKKGIVKVNRRVKITNTHLNKIAGIDLTRDYVPTASGSK